MTWLVTGGAGYIGSHIAAEFIRRGHSVVVADNLVTGRLEFVPEGAVFEYVDLTDRDAVNKLFGRYQITGVAHVAGYKYAGASFGEPNLAYGRNVSSTSNVLAALRHTKDAVVVLSSSAAVYGYPHDDVITEASPVRPESPYGRSKLAAEWMTMDYSRAFGYRCTCLRYLNVVGTGSMRVFDISAHNMVPSVFAAIRNGYNPTIYGADYPTPDGTCIRDYVDVEDVARAEVDAAERLDAGERIAPVYNLGTERGFSVKEVLTAIADVSGIEFVPEFDSRRAGDPARLVASTSLAQRDLAWSPNMDLHSMIDRAWKASNHATNQVRR